MEVDEEQTKTDPMRYALAETVSSSSTLANQSVRKSDQSSIQTESRRGRRGFFVRRGVCTESASHLSPRSRRQEAKGRKLKACALRSGTHARAPSGCLFRDCRLFVARCVDIPSLMVGQAGPIMRAVLGDGAISRQKRRARAREQPGSHGNVAQAVKTMQSKGAYDPH